jgi:hypothetical protein
MKVAIHNRYENLTHNGYLFQPNTGIGNLGHNLLRPFEQLYNFCKSKGINLYTLDQIQAHELDFVIFMDRPVREPHTGKAKKILMIYEPDLIAPDNWDLNYHNQFHKILTWNDEYLRNPKYIKHNFSSIWSERLECKISKDEFESRKLLCMMQSGKASNHPKSLYKTRVDAVLWFQSHASNFFDLYGPHWNTQILSCAKGQVDNKLATYRNYRFTLTIENCMNTGYISEKIQDAFMAGIIPIYLGAPNITNHIPKNCFIHLEKFNSWEQLFHHLNNMDYDLYCEYLDNINNFIESDQSYQFSSTHLIKLLYNLITEKN